MPYRSEIIAPFEHYHIFNRSVRKEDIFLEEKDYLRMLFLMLHLQAPIPFRNIRRFLDRYREKGHFLTKNEIAAIIQDRGIDLCAFAIMPNHFHLLVHELKERGISSYLKRIEGAYAMYFNKKYKKSGYLFQGRFQSVHIASNRQLAYLSAYIHLNSRELPDWKNKEDAYPWSSYQDVISKNRWGLLLRPDVYFSQFGDKNDYRIFVKTSGAKEKKHNEDFIE
ncbi:MAG: transposase [Candidatus Niyogibacteria bacterium]|nr:transposase [Candidatus Niyogibacteria bacterium]